MLRSHRLVIDVIDPPFEGSPDEAWRATAKWCARAAAVTSTASAMSERLAEHGIVAHPLPNACSTELVERPPSEVSDGSLLFVGTIDWRFDTRTLDELASLIPHRRIVIAGRINDDRSSAIREVSARHTNIDLLGPVDESTKQELLERASAALVLFTLDAVGDAINPTKVYEFSAYGLPIVAAATQACRELSPPLFVGDDAASLARHVETVCAQTKPFSGAREFAAANTWAHRAAEVERLLVRYCD